MIPTEFWDQFDDPEPIETPKNFEKFTKKKSKKTSKTKKHDKKGKRDRFFEEEF